MEGRPLHRIGFTRIGGVPRDQWQGASGREAILFSIDDWPAMTKLSLYKKEER
jgi:hypothetical protein